MTIFGQLHPGTPEPPGACRVGTPRPPGVARYPAVSPPPLFGTWDSHVCGAFSSFIYRCAFIKDLKMKIGRIQFWTHHCWMWPHMTQKGWGAVCNKVEDRVSSEKEFSILWRAISADLWGRWKGGKQGGLITRIRRYFSGLKRSGEHYVKTGHRGAGTEMSPVSAAGF